MPIDALHLSRLQFALTTGFHIIFPTLTIGLSLFLAFLEGLALKTGRDVYRRLYRFWVKLFALSFAVGVVSGVVLSFEFGTNFGRFTDFAGDVLGPPMAYEVLTAFFLESGFIGIMLYGEKRVGPGLHFLATFLVAVGTVVSAFWILSANSWMHTPQGYAIGADGIARPTDWIAVIFNPSFPYRLLHMINASMVSSAFVVAGVSAWWLMRGREREAALVAFKLALGMAAVTAPLQLVLGDLHGLNTQAHQPVKVAAMEAHWQTMSGAPLIVFAWPDMEAERNRWEVAIPRLGSLILTHSLDGKVTGLDAAPPEDRPNVPIVFFAFRIMVGIGLLMIAAAFAGQWLRHRRRLEAARWFQRLCIAMAPLGIVATIAGWVVTETGRQPWVIQGVMRTADAVSADLTTGEVATTVVAISVAYTAIFVAFLAIGARLVAKGPPEGEA